MNPPFSGKMEFNKKLLNSPDVTDWVVIQPFNMGAQAVRMLAFASTSIAMLRSSLKPYYMPETGEKIAGDFFGQSIFTSLPLDKLLRAPWPINQPMGFLECHLPPEPLFTGINVEMNS